ncbi:MAG: Arp2/3 complex subunit [Virgibacillus proomii]
MILFYSSDKNQTFVVLVKLYGENEKREKYTLLKIEFLRQGNLNDSLEVAANSNGFIVSAVKALREYFNIEFSKNLGDILKQFNQHFSRFIPTEVKETKSPIEEKAMVSSLSKSDGDEPDKLYCYKVKRNPLKANGELGERSPYNDNKTRIRRRILYEKLSGDKHLSFCYSPDPNAEK